MKYTEVKNITKVVTAKIKKEAEKEKKRIEAEKKELDFVPPEEVQINSQIVEHEDHTESTDKKFLFVGVALLALGGVLYFKNKEV